MGCIPEASVGFPGYNAVIPRSAATVLEILRQNGYGTAWIGKTHLTPMHEITAAGPFDRWPIGMGAEYFYGFFGPGVSQWHPPLWENTTPHGGAENAGGGLSPGGRHGRQDHRLDRAAKVDPSRTSRGSPTTPRTGTSRRSACRASGSRSTGAGSTTATTGSVSGSWRGRRSWGSSRPTPALAPWPEVLPPWDELTDLDKKVGARWMEVFCGAVEHTDYQIGRIVEAIEQTGELDNTLIIYIAGRQRPDTRGRPARHHEQADLLQRRHRVPRGRGQADGRLRRSEVARLLSRRLGLRHVHAVHLRQDGDVGRRAAAPQSPSPGRRGSRTGGPRPAVPPSDRRGARPSWSAPGCRSRHGSTASTRCRWRG